MLDLFAKLEQEKKEWPKKKKLLDKWRREMHPRMAPRRFLGRVLDREPRRVKLEADTTSTKHGIFAKVVVLKAESRAHSIFYWKG